MFSDQQIVTGIAILVSGYATLHDSISAYHWQIMVSLAWFSSITHLTTLTVLRDYLQKRTFLRVTRVFCMFAIVLMLIYALLPTGVPSWLVSFDQTWQPGIPAQCFFGQIYTQDINIDVSISIVFLATNYFTRTVKLFHGTSELLESFSRAIPRRLLRGALTRLATFSVPPGTLFETRQLRRSSVQDSRQASLTAERFSRYGVILWLRFLVFSIFMSVYVVGKAGLDLAETMLWEVCLTLLAFFL